MTDIELLFPKLKEDFDDTETMKMPEPNKRIEGQAFFPGGTGTIDGNESLKGKDVMILGQDFDTADNFEKSFEKDAESNPTWDNIRKLLSETAISESKCFFTNAIIGFRKVGKNSGPSPAFKDEALMEKCRSFFLTQLKIQKPKVIFALGKQVAEFLTSVAKRDLMEWSKIKNFSEVDSKNIAFKKNVQFENNLTANVVLLIHPSFRPSNVGRRKFEDLAGNNAELQMSKKIMG